jgi:uncharacterized protein (DUF2147 family)
MRQLRYLAVLMVLTSFASSARAESYSFVIGGHRIHVEARHGCRSLSCVSWSDSASGNRRDRDDDAAPAKPTTPQAPSPAPAVVQPQPAPSVAPAPAPVVAAPVTRAATETVAPPPAEPKIELASTTTQSVPPPVSKSETKIVVVEKPPVAPPSAPAKARDDETAADTPLGDWQTEGRRGLVRIEQCGKSLCGYVLNEQTDAKGETVLSNMKSKDNAKSDKKWTGDIFSRASGNSYYAKMTQKAPNTLHVEACAVLRFFCSGNDWTRVVKQPDGMVIARPSASAPSS